MGRDIDCHIAEKIMGLDVGWALHFGNSYFGMPLYSHISDWSKTKFEGVGETPYLHSKSKILPDHYQEFGYIQDTGPYKCYRVPPYSTDISSAWAVIDKMKSLGNDCQMHIFQSICRVYFDDLEWQEYSEAESMPEAICLAALKCIAGDKK